MCIVHRQAAPKKKKQPAHTGRNRGIWARSASAARKKKVSDTEDEEESEAESDYSDVR